MNRLMKLVAGLVLALMGWAAEAQAYCTVYIGPAQMNDWASYIRNSIMHNPQEMGKLWYPTAFIGGDPAGTNNWSDPNFIGWSERNPFNIRCKNQSTGGVQNLIFTVVTGDAQASPTQVANWIDAAMNIAIDRYHPELIIVQPIIGGPWPESPCYKDGQQIAKQVSKWYEPSRLGVEEALVRHPLWKRGVEVRGDCQDFRDFRGNLGTSGRIRFASLIYDILGDRFGIF